VLRDRLSGYRDACFLFPMDGPAFVPVCSAVFPRGGGGGGTCPGLWIREPSLTRFRGFVEVGWIMNDADNDSFDDVRDEPDTGGVPKTEDVPSNVSPENIEFLRGLIDSFNASTARLRQAYARLQEKVEKLNIELEETNRNLSRSLEEQERLSNYLTNILESLSSGVLAVDMNGMITLFNRGAEVITGVAIEDALNRHYSEVMGADAPEELTPLGALSSGEGAAQMEKTIRSRTGAKIPVGCSISPLLNSSGEMIGAVEIFMDLSRIKMLEDELARKEKLAALGRMAATMAHKIRNPLGGIAGFAGLLNLELGDNENGKRLVGKITEGVDKLERIVTALLSYTSRLTLETSRIDLAVFLEGMVGSLNETYENVDITVHRPEGSVFAEIDPERFRESTLGIIRNAAEASGGDGEVTVTVLPGESAYVPAHDVERKLFDIIRGSSEIVLSGSPCSLVVVTDSGAGMSAEVKEQLFVPFYTTKENGIGLGLAGARRIIEAHRGEIWIESEENRGTSVGIVLPGI